MVSEESIKTISQIFCGDIEGYYAHKSGSVLVSFFNEYFGYNERYGQGFPSRWVYVYDKIVEMLNAGTVDSFFSCILGKEYLMRDMDRTEVEAIEASKEIMAEFNKDLKVFTSHQTVHTNAVGQYFYCAPEQFMMLRDADKRSDVYSIGRVINFVMTGRPDNSHHPYRAVTEKATSSDASYRYGDAGQLSSFFMKAVQYHRQAQDLDRLNRKIGSRICDEEIENYIYSMGADSISKAILRNQPGFADTLIKFMHINDDHAEYIIQSIDSSFRDVCGRSFEANDMFSGFAYRVLKDSFPYVVKEIAANILRYVAWDVNRFSAQHLVEELTSDGIEPMLQDIISS